MSELQKMLFIWEQLKQGKTKKEAERELSRELRLEKLRESLDT